METPDRSQAKSWEGKDVVDRDGQRLGRCVGVFADTATGVPEWLHVEVEGHVRSFVPALEAAERDGTVRVGFDRDAVVAAPSVGDDDELSRAEEMELYRHYGVPVESDEGSVLPAQDATAGGSAGPTSVPGTSDRTSTGASTTSGALTAADGPAPADATREQDRTGDTTALPATTSGADDDTRTSALADAEPVEGAGVTPETGDQLPVLDPAAASTSVPQDQATSAGPPAGAAAPSPVEEPRPTLRPVPPASPPPVAASSSGSSDLSALTPLGAVAGVAAAVALVLQARDRRARRRASAAARAGRLGASLRSGSSVALASASGVLAGVPDAADRTRRSAAVAAERAAAVAAERQERAAAATRRQRQHAAAALAAASTVAAQRTSQAAAALESASSSASTSVERQRKAAKASLATTSKSVRKQRKAAKASLAKASEGAGRTRGAATAALSTGLSTGRSRGSATTTAVTSAPGRVAKRGRKARRSVARTLWDTVVLGAAAGGYVLGAKAGRERYDELAQVASAVAGNPKVQSATEAVTDPERRGDLLVEVQQQAGSLVGRREPRR